MKKFRYTTSGKCYKGGVHVHSTASDGCKTVAELAELYSSEGYSFLCRTDHWVLPESSANQAGGSLLWLDGVELDGQDSTGNELHVVCIGSLEGITQESGLEAGIKAAREQGALLILAHPYWCGNSLSDCNRWQFDGLEIYNHVCQWLNGKGDAGVYWNAALLDNPNTLAFSVDDAHLSPDAPGWNGGWIVVNAKNCSTQEIMAALWRGNFYSSCGPEFYSIEWDGYELHISTSPVRFLRIVGPVWNGTRAGSFDGPLITHTSLPIPTDWQYAYVEIEDEMGKRAWTNNLFIDELGRNL